MALITSDENYNAETRYLEQKVVIHFPGITPLEITRDNYLVTTSILEEAHSSSGSAPFGGVTSNEFSVDLINEGGIFSPTNPASPYFGKMRRGVKMEVFIRPKIESDNEEELYKWDPMGVYYVTDWNATVTGLIAVVTGNDKLYSIFNGDVLSYPIRKGISQHDFYADIFRILGLPAKVDESLTEPLKYAYVVDKVKELLVKLGISSMADCFCGHDGNIRVINLTADRDLRATITDADQIIDAKIEQALLSGYDGAAVICNAPQEGQIENILTLKELTVLSGNTTVKNVALLKSPLVRLCYLILTGAPNAVVSAAKATPRTLTYTTTNMGVDCENCTLAAFGTFIETNKMSIADEGENLLSVNNIYIQTPEYAQIVYSHIKAYVNNVLPVLEIVVRGNPRLELCDKIRAISEKYNLDYTGILIKQEFNYDGGLSSKITLLNIDILQEVN